MNVSGTGSHLDHFLRQTRVHHVQLSAMADTKANMMLTLSALVITFSIGYLSNTRLKWAALVLIVGCLGTVISATYAAMPKLPGRSRPDLEHPDCNMLFFGNFMNLEYEEYAKYMEGVMNDSSTVYESQVREVYELGVFLGRKKYPYVRLAYLFFLGGVLVSGLVLIGIELMGLARP